MPRFSRRCLKLAFLLTLLNVQIDKWEYWAQPLFSFLRGNWENCSWNSFNFCLCVRRSDKRQNKFIWTWKFLAFFSLPWRKLNKKNLWHNFFCWERNCFMLEIDKLKRFLIYFRFKFMKINRTLKETIIS